VEKGKTRRVRLKPINREQMVLWPVDVEALVPEDHEVRAILEFVGRLDLRRYYEDVEMIEGEAGRPALDPRLIRSSPVKISFK
jgi:transposase